MKTEKKLLDIKFVFEKLRKLFPYLELNQKKIALIDLMSVYQDVNSKKKSIIEGISSLLAIFILYKEYLNDEGKKELDDLLECFTEELLLAYDSYTIQIYKNALIQTLFNELKGLMNKIEALIKQGSEVIQSQIEHNEEIKEEVKKIVQKIKEIHLKFQKHEFVTVTQKNRMVIVNEINAFKKKKEALQNEFKRFSEKTIKKSDVPEKLKEKENDKNKINDDNAMLTAAVIRMINTEVLSPPPCKEVTLFAKEKPKNIDQYLIVKSSAKLTVSK